MGWVQRDRATSTPVQRTFDGPGTASPPHSDIFQKVPNSHAISGRNVGAVDPTVMRTRVARARVGRLATLTPPTADRGGQPHIVPCCFVLVDDTIYSAVDGKPKTTPALQRLANVRAQPQSCLLVDHYAEDWTALWWVRVDGAARVVATDSERGAAIGALQAKYEQYRQEPPPGAVLAIAIERWRGWSYDDTRPPTDEDTR